jgi:hypothetical protein
MLKDATLEQLQKLSEQEKSSEKWVWNPVPKAIPYRDLS